MTDTLTPVAPVDYAVTASEAYRSALAVIESVEPRIADATRAELADQRSSLKLIASENYASPAVLLTMGSWLSDKYAEGTVGHRFYAGCQNIDTVESLAAEHARELFGAEYAYAQPHSGIDANLVAFWAILANRIELPELAVQGVKGLNDLTEQQWEDLRHKFGNSERWACPSTPAVTSLTASDRTFPARCFTSARTEPTRRLSCSTTAQYVRLPASSGP